MADNPHRQIAVEGCPGVGKTTLAGALASFRQASLVLEEFGKNPFLEGFYANPLSDALETELQFLLLHFHQLKEAAQRAEEAAEIITDFTLFKDTIFATATLVDPAEKEIFDMLYQFLSAKLATPDLVIYLRGSDSLILDRIRHRNRSMEMRIDAAYFARLNRAYEQFFSGFTRPFQIIDADQMDCIQRPEAVEEVSKRVDAALGVRRGSSSGHGRQPS